MEFHDYSKRRGVLVPILPEIHSILKENASRDTMSGLQPPEHFVTWQHKMSKELVDINRRFILAMDGRKLAGFLFYRYEGTDIFIEDLQIAWEYRKNPLMVEGFLKRLEYDSGTKDAIFFASERVKIEADKELLATKGFKQEFEGGWEKLGTFKETAGALKLRYNRGASD